MNFNYNKEQYSYQKQKSIIYIAKASNEKNILLENSNSDLVNNLDLFHEHYSQKTLNRLPDWADTSNYEHFQSLEELIESIDLDNIDYSLTYSIRVPIEYIWSSIERAKGFDRTIEVFTKPKYLETAKKNLNKTDPYTGKKRGYCSKHANSLHGMIRISDEKHPKTGQDYKLIVLNKTQGNNRTLMKLLAHKGVPTDILMNVEFHDPSIDKKLLSAIEADIHSTDATDRSNQNEKQKFHSAFRSGRQEYVDCFNFLRDNDLDYDGLMKLEGHSTEGRITLTNLNGLTSGRKLGIFSKYGEKNVLAAVNTVRRICLDITKEDNIPAVPIHCLALFYKIMTELPYSERYKDPLLTVNECHEFLILFFTYKNAPLAEQIFGKVEGQNEVKFSIKRLAQSSGMKDIPYLVATTFWSDDELMTFYKTRKNRRLGFGAGCDGMQYLISKSDSVFRKQIRSLVA